MKKYEVVYMAVSADKYSLPMAVFDTLLEASIWEGCSVNYMCKKLKEHLLSNKKDCYFIRVKYEQDD